MSAALRAVCSTSRQTFLRTTQSSARLAQRPLCRTFISHAEPTYLSLQDEFDIDEWPEFDGDDTTVVGHRILREQREHMHYLRLIEAEIPKLQAFRKPFQPPASSKATTIRTIWYGGEAHPVERKAVAVIPVSSLPLKTPEAIHKLKLLAGPRWYHSCPKDGGFGGEEEIRKLGKEGWVKISCEDYETRNLNVKWCSDVLNKMVEEANNKADTFTDVPVDKRHLVSRAKKQKLGEYHSRRARRPTLADFPQGWLPQQPQVTSKLP